MAVYGATPLHRSKPMEQTLLLLQLSDNAFPTGGFSHSLGLESSVQHRLIQNTDDLRLLIQHILENTGSFSLLFVQDAYRAGSDVEELKRLDRLCQVCTANHVANRANYKQGRAMADTVSKVFDMSHLQRLQYQHYPVVYGAVCSGLGLPLLPSLTSFMSSVARAVLASAVRLDKLGPLEAQRILVNIHKLIPDIIERNCTRSSEEACLKYPLVDILQNSHDKLFCKLFHS